MKTNHYLCIIISVVILLAGVSACDRGVPPGNTSDPEMSQTEPDIRRMMESLNIQPLDEVIEAPDFTLSSLDGQEVSLSQYRGKVVLLSFWATW